MNHRSTGTRFSAAVDAVAAVLGAVRFIMGNLCLGNVCEFSHQSTIKLNAGVRAEKRTEASRQPIKEPRTPSSRPPSCENEIY